MQSIQKVAPILRSIAGQRTASSSILSGVHIITCNDISSANELLSRLLEYDNVLYAEPIYQEQLLLIPNDPDAQQGGNQEYLEVVKAYEAWDINQGDPNIVIGIVDTGLDLLHEDIVDNIYINANEIPNNGIDDDNNGMIDDYQGYDFADNDSNPQSETSFHGNRVGGVAGAVPNNGIGMAGIGFNTKISPLKVFQTTSNLSSGNYGAIIYAADNDYDVINLSWGSTNSFSQFSQDVINYAVLEKDVVVVAAAGNTPEELDFYPASYDNVLSISATNLDDSKANFASYSTNVDLVAPGNQIYSSFRDNGYARDNGTSYSAPMVAGAAALMRSQYPELSARQIMELIRVNTDEIYDLTANSPYFEKLGKGRLNIEKALLRENNKSLRVTDFSPSGTFDTYVFFDDSVKLNLEMLNHLGTLDNVSLSISSTSNFVTILNDELPLGSVSSNANLKNNSTILYLSDDTPPGEEIVVRIGISDNDYLDYQYLRFKTQENFLVNDNAKFSMTVAGNGNLGFAEDGFSNGNGIVWNGNKIANNIGLAISANNLISDNWPLEKDAVIRSRDFLLQKNIKLQRQENADFTTYSVFEDAIANNPLGVTIEQKTFSFDSTILSNGMILQSRLINTSADTIKGLKAGLFTNWNLTSAPSNRSYFDQGVLIAQNNTGSIYTGIKLYAEKSPVYQAIDADNFNGNTLDIPLSFSDSLKIALLKESAFDSAGFIGSGNDIINILGSAGDTLLLGSSIKKTYLIAAASSLDSLFLTISALEAQYEKILRRPVLLKKVLSCEGAIQPIIPEPGSDFRFYTDVFGEKMILENDTLVISEITGDTAFYVQKVNENYLSDIQRIDIELTSKVSQFLMSTDTLYLDDPIKNFVTFTDLSFNAINWQWNFGNETQASIQNPSTLYNSAGTYQVSLTVTNEIGCSDIETRTLVVAPRPSLPSIEDIFICPGEIVVLKTEQQDSLLVYKSQTDNRPVVRGSEINIQHMDNDTILYVTRLADGFESLRKAVKINKSSVKANFIYKPDLAKETVAILLINQSIADSIRWQISNEVFYTDSVSIPVNSSSLSVTLEAFDSLGCVDVNTSVIDFTQSATPTVQFDQPCRGTDLIIQPKNGKYFGLYADVALTSLIAKGENFEIKEINDTLNYFIAGLDSILPSTPVNVIIKPIAYEVEVIASPSRLYLSESKRVNLSTDNPKTTSWSWFLNDTFFETAANPIIFFDSVGTYKLTLNAVSVDHCVESVTLNYEVLQSRPITLASRRNYDVNLFPNPVKNSLKIDTQLQIKRLTINSIMGKEMKVISEIQNRNIELNMSEFKSGIYFITIQTELGVFTEKIYKID
ncbi:MAG: S8 family serine peptidase [Cyclobacteriaceae bacterium]